MAIPFSRRHEERKKEGEMEEKKARAFLPLPASSRSARASPDQHAPASGSGYQRAPARAPLHDLQADPSEALRYLYLCPPGDPCSRTTMPPWLLRACRAVHCLLSPSWPAPRFALPLPASLFYLNRSLPSQSSRSAETPHQKQPPPLPYLSFP